MLSNRAQFFGRDHAVDSIRKDLFTGKEWQRRWHHFNSMNMKFETAQTDDGQGKPDVLQSAGVLRRVGHTFRLTEWKGT